MTSEKRIKVRVVSGAGGHRRIGRFWPPKATDAEVPPEQLRELQGDARMSVLIVEAPAAKP